jgi:hypothetical protein
LSARVQAVHADEKNMADTAWHDNLIVGPGWHGKTTADQADRQGYS